ncbi:hypothetical protein JIN85_00070 [Luteolibacter pohnpeiensis]|uniref:Uncharacterized protein n=1 Tax=Luteolibacter pohnpeiensis TaxID=454153 RepID=A0A934S466_9BACT|nr:hypothetical protein [Luteolibacter pohnpeiensis]MBK1880784.1 hypothetical protein [Luteolibacter pohnpeiensis]
MRNASQANERHRGDCPIQISTARGLSFHFSTPCKKRLADSLASPYTLGLRRAV